MVSQCPCCGRLPIDWGSKEALRTNDQGTKDRQRDENIDRCADYRKWRWGFGNGCYVSDIDQVEWRIIEGVPTPVACLELSRVDGNVHVPDTYLQAVLKRYKRDGQKETICALAKKLGVDAFLVLFRWDLSEFWIYNLSRSPERWKHCSQAQYEKWIRQV